MRSEFSLFLGCRDSFVMYEENPGIPVFNCQRLKGGQESMKDGGPWRQ